MVNLDNSLGLTSVLKFHTFLMLTIKNLYVFVSSAKDWVDFFSDVETRYQFLTRIFPALIEKSPKILNLKLKD